MGLVCSAGFATERRWQRASVGLVLGAAMSCGPGTVPAEGSGSGDSGVPASTSASPSASASEGASPTSAATTSSSTTGITSATDTNADSTTTGPPGQSCPKPPVITPPLPEGCEHAWLVDADGNAIEGAPSGLVSCPDPDPNEILALRTGFVPCPELLGNECLCDADCERGEACICASTLSGRSNICLRSDCDSSDDCRGHACRIEKNFCTGGWFPQSIRCTTVADDCYYDSECNADDWDFCDYDETMELFTCKPGAICE